MSVNLPILGRGTAGGKHKQAKKGKQWTKAQLDAQCAAKEQQEKQEEEAHRQEDRKEGGRTGEQAPKGCDVPHNPGQDVSRKSGC